MKRLIFLFVCCTQFLAAQDFSVSWNGHFSYNNIQALDFSNGKIYAAAENSVFIRELNTGGMEEISSVNGLSGEQISAIHYSQDFQVLVIGYENGLIEIKKNNDDNILKVIDIVEKPTISPINKRINHFHEANNKLFVSTNYGISVYNMGNMEFGDTYFIGDGGSQLRVLQTTVHINNRIYAVTQGGGIKNAELNNPNLIDHNQWQSFGNPGGTWRGIASVDGKLYVSSINFLYRVHGSDLSLNYSFPNPVKGKISVVNGYMTLVTATGAFTFNADGEEIASIPEIQDPELSINTAIFDGADFYLGDSNHGLVSVNPGNIMNLDFIHPMGPLHNRIFNIETAGNDLWAVFGEYNIDYNPFPLNYRGASRLRANEWHNLSPEELFGAAVLVNITINPAQPDHVFLSSFRNGLIEIMDGEPQMIYDHTNGLDEIQVPNHPGDVRVNGGAFDKQGNLWFVNSMVDEGLKVLTPGGEVQGVDITSEISNPVNDNGFDQLVIDANDNIYFGTQKNGVIAYQSSTGELRKITSSANLPSNDIRGMVIDNNNVLWIGTTRGLRVLYNPASVFSQNVATNAIIILDDDEVAQELLFEQFISDIEVDGSNNKWIATATSGVFYLSSNGQETLAHFTRDNSPLPSNNVTSVSIDETGNVYFGTINGLVSYRGSATQPRENLENVFAYPNPVRPGFSGNVVIDGLMRNSNVKITDIEGNLVYEEFSDGGSIQWDTTAFGRYKVASGVYLVLITSEDQAETKVAKIMVVR